MTFFAKTQPMNDVVIDILHNQAMTSYDGRQHLTLHEPDYEDKKTEGFRKGYMCFKYAVAAVLDPQRICEIGVGTGVAAVAFLTACPEARYLGIDNRSMEQERGGPSLVDETRELLSSFPDARCTFVENDSQRMCLLPDGPYDLIHVDGDHRREGCRHDVTLAWDALAPNGYILVDDARHSAVAAGAFDALDRIRTGAFDWAYFGDTWTGSLLIRKELTRP